MRWLNRFGFFAAGVSIAVIFFVCGRWREVKGERQADTIIHLTDPLQKAEGDAVVKPEGGWNQWVVTSKSSRHASPHSFHVCLDDNAPGELITCAGKGDRPGIDGPRSVTASCTYKTGKRILSLVESKDLKTIRYRSEYEDTDPHEVGWVETTMTYERECPLSWKDNQPLVLLNLAGKATDQASLTSCMITVLKSVPRVTDPEAGFSWGDNGAPWPFVRYTYPGRHNQPATVVTFSAVKDAAGNPQTAHFQAILGDLYAIGDKGPDDYGSTNIAKLWKARCGVDAETGSPTLVN